MIHICLQIMGKMIEFIQSVNMYFTFHDKSQEVYSFYQRFFLRFASKNISIMLKLHIIIYYYQSGLCYY